MIRPPRGAGPSTSGTKARGGLDAELDLQPETLEALRAGTYKYLSPVIRFNADQRVTGLSSISLVNNPNLPLTAPALNNEQTMTDTDTTTRTTTDAAAQLAARETEVAAREKTADQRLLTAATHAVDQAVAAGQMLPAHKAFHLATIQAHKDGIDAGLSAFTAFVAASAETDGGVDLHALGARDAPDARRPAWRAPDTRRPGGPPAGGLPAGRGPAGAARHDRRPRQGARHLVPRRRARVRRAAHDGRLVEARDPTGRDQDDRHSRRHRDRPAAADRHGRAHREA